MDRRQEQVAVEIERRAAERRAVVRRAVDIHDKTCDCPGAVARRKEQHAD